MDIVWGHPISVAAVWLLAGIAGLVAAVMIAVGMIEELPQIIRGAWNRMARRRRV